jgi:hypothetical protein
MFEEDSTHPEIYGWSQSALENHVPANPDNDYVYVTLADDDGVVGRITARLVPTEVEREFYIAMAFCDKEDTFSRQAGRLMVDEKVKHSHTMRVRRRFVSNTSFDIVRDVVKDLMKQGFSNMILENHEVDFPEWVKPEQAIFY